MSTYKTSDSSSTTGLMQSSKTYTRSGIGGAGNYRKSTPSIAVTSSLPVPRATGLFYTGIGGSGNSRSYEERASISFEEDLAREALRKENAPSSWYNGIGGVGNRAGSFDTSRASSFRGSVASSHMEKGRLASFFKN